MACSVKASLSTTAINCSKFPDSKIESKLIKTVSIKNFMEKNFKKKIIDFFSVDIEGADFNVIMSLDLKK